MISNEPQCVHSCMPHQSGATPTAHGIHTYADSPRPSPRQTDTAADQRSAATDKEEDNGNQHKDEDPEHCHWGWIKER